MKPINEQLQNNNYFEKSTLRLLVVFDPSLYSPAATSAIVFTFYGYDI